MKLSEAQVVAETRFGLALATLVTRVLPVVLALAVVVSRLVLIVFHRALFTFLTLPVGDYRIGSVVFLTTLAIFSDPSSLPVHPGILLRPRLVFRRRCRLAVSFLAGLRVLLVGRLRFDCIERSQVTVRAEFTFISKFTQILALSFFILGIIVLEQLHLFAFAVALHILKLEDLHFIFVLGVHVQLVWVRLPPQHLQDIAFVAVVLYVVFTLDRREMIKSGRTAALTVLLLQVVLFRLACEPLFSDLVL